MKLLQALFMTATLSQFAAPVLVQTALAAETVSPQQAAIVEAAAAFTYRTGLARESLETLSKKTPASDLSKAARLALGLNKQTQELTVQIQRHDSQADILNKFSQIEGDLLQFEAAKRAILSRYPSDARLRMTMNNVRRTFYYLKQLLTGSV